MLNKQRTVAQLGSALDWGSRGRRFKSCQSDSYLMTTSAKFFALVVYVNDMPIIYKILYSAS